MRSLIFLIAFFAQIVVAHSQSVDIPSLFKPGVRLGALYMPEFSVNDTVKYGMWRVRSTVIVPLNGNVQVDLKNLNLSAHQSFLTLNTGIRNTGFSPVKSGNSIYNFALGFTHVRASLANGFWIYHARIIADNDLVSRRNNFISGLAGGAKIYVKSLDKINIFGAGVVYSHPYVIPFPVVGLRRKINSKLTLTAVIPLELDLNLKLNDKVELEFKNALAALKTGFQVEEQNPHLLNYRNDNLILSNYNLQSSLIVMFSVSKNMQLYAEGGVYPYLMLNLKQADNNKNIATYNHFFAPYFGITARYSLGEFRFGSQIFGTDE